MFKKAYPSLFKAFPFSNFEIILKTLNEHFNDIFNSDILEQEAREGRDKSSYWQLFAACMQEANELYTEKEIVSKLHDTLKNYTYEQFIFVPSLGNQPAKQLAFLEKTATGSLKAPEPLTLIDMKRYLAQLKKEKSFKVEALHLTHLQCLTYDEIYKNQALLINFNRNLSGTPKWGVLDLTHKYNPKVFCETPLSEAEKNALDAALNINITAYEKACANSLPSTGYAALAWLENKHTKYCNFDVNADFPALL